MPGLNQLRKNRMTKYENNLLGDLTKDYTFKLQKWQS